MTRCSLVHPNGASVATSLFDTQCTQGAPDIPQEVHQYSFITPPTLLIVAQLQAIVTRMTTGMAFRIVATLPLVSAEMRAKNLTARAKLYTTHYCLRMFR